MIKKDVRHNIPRHVAIIPDGNRRWARARGLQPWDGHEEGAKRIEEIARKAKEIGITHISFWGSSVDNMTKRPIRERQELVRVYERYFTKLINSEEIAKDRVRINIFGYWQDRLPTSLVKVLQQGIEKTRENERYHMNFFLLYSGEEEMRDAISEMVDVYDSGSQITKDTIKKHLMTRDLPPVDYMIRTGGEPHLSAGFLMWDMANAQLFFSQRNFPDFDAMCFAEAIDEYEKRQRRLGS